MSTNASNKLEVILSAFDYKLVVDYINKLTYIYAQTKHVYMKKHCSDSKSSHILHK